MTENREPQKSDSEESNNNWQEVEFQLKTRIADAVLWRQITDDNPSDINGYTALEQVIMYEFNIDDDEDIEDIKDEIICLARDLELDDEDKGLLVRAFDQDKINKKIAKSIIHGIITDDKESPWSGLSSLEQIISYECGSVDVYVIFDIKKAIKGTQFDLRGGYKMQHQDDFWDDFVEEIEE